MRKNTNIFRCVQIKTQNHFFFSLFFLSSISLSLYKQCSFLFFGGVMREGKGMVYSIAMKYIKENHFFFMRGFGLHLYFFLQFKTKLYLGAVVYHKFWVLMTKKKKQEKFLKKFWSSKNFLRYILQLEEKLKKNSSPILELERKIRKTFRIILELTKFPKSFGFLEKFK